MKHPFFKNQGPFKINDLLKDLKFKNKENLDNNLVKDIKDLQSADKDHLTFFHSKKYHLQASKTNAGYCITHENLSQFLPKGCKPILADNILLTVSQITSKKKPLSKIL